MISIKLSRPLLARVAGYGLALVVLSGCDRIKDLLTKNADAGLDAAALVDAAPPVVVADDAAAPDAAVAVPVVAADDTLPSPDAELTKANREIGFGNYKDELDKLQKEADTASQKK
jgi:hypothetical protein